MYGIENMVYNKSLQNEIARTEGNLIKRIIGIPTRCRTTSLHLALNISSSRTYLENMKTELFLRLISNSYIKKNGHS